MDRKRFLWLSAIAVSLGSCDTRDDWFLEHGEEPVIKMETSSDTLGGEYWEGKRYRVVEVGWGRPDTLSFSIEDPYGKECSYDFKITSIPEENIANGVHETELLYFLGPEICHWQVEEKMGSYNMGNYRENAFKYTEPLLKLTKSNGKVIFSLGKKDYFGGSIAGDYFESRARLYSHENDPYAVKYLNSQLIDRERHLVPFSKEVSARFTMTARNKIGVETTEYVLVKIKPNHHMCGQGDGGVQDNGRGNGPRRTQDRQMVVPLRLRPLRESGEGRSEVVPQLSKLQSGRRRVGQPVRRRRPIRCYCDRKRLYSING